MFKSAIVLTFLILINLQAQKYDFKTHSSILNGELTTDDIYEPDFGRFDAYELQMEEGDFIIMKLNASFFPLLTVVAPSSEYQVAFQNDDNPEVVFKQEIDETGLWQIYIAGDSTDLGSHSLKLCYVSQESRTLPEDANYCTLINFFLSHSETNFFYFREENYSLKDGKKELKMDSQDLFEKGEIFTKNDISKLSLFFNPGISSFDTISADLKTCLKKNWNIRETKNKFEFVEIEGLRKISFVKNKTSFKLTISTK
jgi:hypothetical protein